MVFNRNEIVGIRYNHLCAGTWPMVRGLACLKDSGGYTGAGVQAPGMFDQAGKISDDDPDEAQHLVLQVGGWVWS